MSRQTSTFDTVRKIALELPEVEETTTWRAPALKVRGKLLACMSVHKSAEPDSLVVRIDFDQRAALLAEAPGTYYITYHYENYPSVLVRLPQIPPDQLRDLLHSAWHFVTRQDRRKSRTGAAKKRPARGTRITKTQ